MSVELTALHWVYLLFIVLILGLMIIRRDTSMACIAGIFVLGLVSNASLSGAISGVFNGFIYAITELLGTILIISLIVAMSKILSETGANELMIVPIAGLIKSPALAYWVIGIVMMVISWFFWPSPGVALIGAVLLPVALRVGLPALGAAMAMNLFGHGIALSGDFVIQGAPSLTAGAAGIPVGEVINASIPLVFVMGIVTTVAAFIILKKDLNTGKLAPPEIHTKQNGKSMEYSLLARITALVVPLLFILDVAAMSVLNLQGGDATALVGGTAIAILVGVSFFEHGDSSLEKITEYLIEGFQFGFRVFGPVIPIAAFFYLGDAGIKAILGEVLPANSHGLVNDLGLALANAVPLNKQIGAVTLTVVGCITGLDGSGFSGISLAGSIAKLFGTALHASTATLTALGQIAGIWVGGGTIIPWALIPVAAICNVDPFDLARKNLLPVLLGLIITTLIAMFLV
ncbi:hypothetical protein [Zhaonella formicivorans]|uniref:hypothetical protein n=1 Tax=Zhaonella formicivorans TaxID=2528593 RepID=UPI0010E8417C|nr:hypothetical protein [Zhaonella formicivorans]